MTKLVYFLKRIIVYNEIKGREKMKYNYCNKRADEWYREITSEPSKIPLSFCYDDEEYFGFSE